MPLFGSGFERTAGDFSSEGFRRMIDRIGLSWRSVGTVRYMAGRVFRLWALERDDFGSYGRKRKEVEDIGEERQVEVDREGRMGGISADNRERENERGKKTRDKTTQEASGTSCTSYEAHIHSSLWWYLALGCTGSEVGGGKNDR